MSRLIIVAGAGGAGKSFFLDAWASYDSDAVCIKKFVSSQREPRKIEIIYGKSDLIFDNRYNPETELGKQWLLERYPDLANQQFSKLNYHNKIFNSSNRDEPYTYNYGKATYEIDMETIRESIANGKNPIVIVRDTKTILELKQLYTDALVIYVQSILSGEELVNKLVDLGEAREDAKKRQEKNKKDLDNYIDSLEKFEFIPRVVLNDYSDEDGNVHKQIRDIYKHEIANYKFVNHSVFVIQSYKEEKDADRFFKTVVEACKNKIFPMQVNRALEQKSGSSYIQSKVFELLNNSDYFICDISPDRNVKLNEGEGAYSDSVRTSVNIWLELGYAYSLISKRALKPESRLIVCCNADYSIYMPSDIGPIDILYYKSDDTWGLRDEISQRIDKMLESRND